MSCETAALSVSSETGVGLHFDSFGNLAGLHDDIHPGLLRHRQRDVVGHRLLEAGGLYGDPVDSGRKVRGGEIPVHAAFGMTGYTGSDVHDVDLRVGHHRARIVGHGSQDCAVGASLAVQQARRQNHKQTYHQAVDSHGRIPPVPLGH